MSSSFYKNPDVPLADFLDDARQEFNLQYKRINEPDERNPDHWIPLDDAYRNNAAIIKGIRQGVAELFDGMMTLQIMSTLYSYESYQLKQAEDSGSFLTFVQGFRDDIDSILLNLSKKLRES